MAFLSLKQENFCREFIKCRGNATEAVRQAYPGVKTANARWQMAHKLVRNGKVRGRISEILGDADILGALCQSIKKGLEAKKPLLVNGKIVLVDDSMAILETVKLVYKIYGLL